MSAPRPDVMAADAYVACEILWHERSGYAAGVTAERGRAEQAMSAVDTAAMALSMYPIVGDDDRLTKLCRIAAERGALAMLAALRGDATDPPCPACHGEGIVLPATVANEAEARAMAPRCEACDGTGTEAR